MMGKSHLIIGVSTTLLVERAAGYAQPLTFSWSGLTGTSALVVLGLAAAVGSWMPDIDNSSSTIAYRTGTGRNKGCLNALVFDPLRHVLGGHRALTHSLWAILAVGFIFGFQPFPSLLGWPGLTPWADIGTAFTMGYVLHILADLLTKEGVKFLWPLQNHEFRLLPRGLRFRTGSIQEYALMGLFCLAVVGIWLKM
jgi:inner membrane protein